MKTEPPKLQWLSWSKLPTAAPLTLGGGSDVVVVVPYVKRAQAARTCRILIDRAGSPVCLLPIHDDEQVGPLAIWNRLLQLTHNEYFAYVADDAFPGRGWLNIALQAMQRHPQAGLFAFNDGKWFGQLAGFGLVRRSWVKTLYDGALFHPGYHQHYADTELTLIARQQAALIHDPNALLVEVDSQKDKRLVNPADRLQFLERKKNGFEGRVTHPGLLGMFG